MEFVNEIIATNDAAMRPAREAFASSYAAGKKKKRFTKVQMDIAADRVLQDYFKSNITKIERWFNVISPKNRSMEKLKEQIEVLSNKNWKKILET